MLSVRIHVLVDESQACFSTDVFLQAAHPRAWDGPAKRPTRWRRVPEPSPRAFRALSHVGIPKVNMWRFSNEPRHAKAGCSTHLTMLPCSEQDDPDRRRRLLASPHLASQHLA